MIALSIDSSGHSTVSTEGLTLAIALRASEDSRVVTSANISGTSAAMTPNGLVSATDRARVVFGGRLRGDLSLSDDSMIEVGPNAELLHSIFTSGASTLFLRAGLTPSDFTLGYAFTGTSRTVIVSCFEGPSVS